MFDLLKTLLVSGGLILGLLGILGRMQRSLWWRGEKIFVPSFYTPLPSDTDQIEEL